MQIVKISQKADALGAGLCIAFSLWYAAQGRYTPMLLCALMAAISALSAKYKPIQWAARKVLLYRLKH